MEEKIVVGLDIGSSKVCAVVGKMNEYGRLEVLGLGQAPCSGVVRGVVTNIDRTVDAIVKAINEAETQANVNILEVNVSISGQQIRSIRERTGFTRLSADKEITVEDVMRLNEDMRRIQPPVGNQILHVVPQDYSVDYASGIYDPVGMLGVKLEGEFHVITAPFAAIANIQKCIEKADRLLGKRGQLKIGERVLEPIAAGMAVLMDEEKEAGVAMVDIGGDTTDIAIFHKNIIRHTSVIPFGGNIVTRDIEEGCTIQAKYAELLKIRFGLALSEPASWNEVVSIPVLPGRPPKEISIKNLAYIIEARMEEIVEMIYAELSRAGYDRLTGGIVLTGGGSQLQYLRELFELTTGLHTRIGNPNQHMGRSQNEAVKAPMYAAAVGLVMAGFRAIDERENDYLKAKPAMAAGPPQPQQQQQPRKEREQDGNGKQGGGRFFNSILDRTRRFLSDDMDDRMEY